eukprot:PITA_09897
MKKPAKSKQIVCSPRPRMITKRMSRACPLQSQFAWYNDDIWTAIAQFLDAKSIVRLALVNHHFYNMVMDDSIWKFICLRDLEVPPPRKPVQFSWKDIYTSAFDGSHSYSIRLVEKHIDWMRIGAFSFDSGEVLVTEKISEVKATISNKEKGKFKIPTKACLLSDVKTGIWIAGTMQTLDVRHFELFLHKEYKDGSWEYAEVGSHIVQCNCLAATAGIFDGMHIKSDSTLGENLQNNALKASDFSMISINSKVLTWIRSISI